MVPVSKTKIVNDSAECRTDGIVYIYSSTFKVSKYLQTFRFWKKWDFYFDWNLIENCFPSLSEFFNYKFLKPTKPTLLTILMQSVYDYPEEINNYYYQRFVFFSKPKNLIRWPWWLDFKNALFWIVALCDFFHI